MPLYFFDTDDGESFYRDDIGVELSSDDEAREQGTVALAELARDEVPRGPPLRRFTMRIRKGGDTPLAQLEMSFAAHVLE